MVENREIFIPHLYIAPLQVVLSAKPHFVDVVQKYDLVICNGLSMNCYVNRSMLVCRDFCYAMLSNLDLRKKCLHVALQSLLRILWNNVSLIFGVAQLVRQYLTAVLWHIVHRFASFLHLAGSRFLTLLEAWSSF